VPLKEDLVIREGEKERYENIVLLVDEATSSGPRHTSNGTREGRDEGHPRWPIYTAFGVGAVGLFVGLLAGGLALNTQATLNAECPTKNTCPQSEQSDIDALYCSGKRDGVRAGQAPSRIHWRRRSGRAIR